MTPPLVSIVVPVYNSEKTISKCLDSLISQTFKDIEIICVNDCSKDNSLQVLNKYASKDSRIAVINHEENMNAGGARNSGIKAAKGEYVCLVDNDDWLRLDALELLCREIEPDVTDMVTADWVTYYSEDNQIINKNLPCSDNFERCMEYTCIHGFRMLGTLYRRTMFLSHNLYFPEKVFYEDNAIERALFCMSRNFKYVEEPLYYYASAPNSVTSSASLRKAIDRIMTTELYIANLKRLNLYDSYKPLFDFVCLRLCFNTLVMISHFSKKESSQHFNRLVGIINDCLPCSYFKSLSRVKQIALKFPKLTYCVLNFLFKTGIVSIVKKIKQS